MLNRLQTTARCLSCKADADHPVHRHPASEIISAHAALEKLNLMEKGGQISVYDTNLSQARQHSVANKAREQNKFNQLLKKRKRGFPRSS